LLQNQLKGILVMKPNKSTFKIGSVICFIIALVFCFTACSAQPTLTENVSENTTTSNTTVPPTEIVEETTPTTYKEPDYTIAFNETNIMKIYDVGNGAFQVHCEFDGTKPNQDFLHITLVNLSLMNDLGATDVSFIGMSGDDEPIFITYENGDIIPATYIVPDSWRDTEDEDAESYGVNSVLHINEALGISGTQNSRTSETTTESTTAVDLTPTVSNIYTGNGDDVIEIELLPEISVFQITGNADGRHFSVKGYNSDGDSTDLFVNTSDVYNGTVIDPTQETSLLEISATGEWEVEVSSIYSQQMISIGDTINGSGDEILLIKSYGKTASISGNPNERHFAVKTYGAAGNDLLINTTDVYDGKVMLNSEPVILEISAVGEWSVTFN
jgi:hypothetical protein